jgi:phage-related minor tail protein
MEQNTKVVKFEPSLLEKYGAEIVEQIAAKSEEYSQLTFDAENYDASAKALRTVVTTRTGIEARRKELKDPILEAGKTIDAAAKYLTGLVLPIEQQLQAKKDAADKIEADRKAAKKAAEEEARRKEAEAKLEAKRLADEAAAAAERERLAAIEREQARIREEQQAEARRLAAERAAFEAEQARVRADEEETARKAAAARQAEADRIAAAQKAEQDRIDTERRALEEQKRQAAEAERVRLAKEEATRIAKETAEREAREAEERRIAELERQAEIQRRLDVLKPDAEKIHVFADRVHKSVNDEWPELASPEAVEFLQGVANNIKKELRRAMLFGKVE